MSDRDVLHAAAELAVRHLDNVDARHVGSRATRAALGEALGGPLPEAGADPVDVLRQLAARADAGLVATPGPRYFGFVTGGALPVAVAGDWLASTWDQNVALYVMSPAMAVMEEIVAGWILDLLRLPETASVGFVTGAHMANFTCLAAARHEVLRRAGWNVEDEGLQRAPRLTVIVGHEVHVSVVGAARMLGIGANELVRVSADRQGRMDAGELERVLAQCSGPVVVCAQAGNVNTGASDPMEAIVTAAHARGAWVHVDGAFGLWAAAVAQLEAQVDGVAAADSWTTDAHKWLNVPYDSGLAIVRNPAPHRAAMSLHASYLARGRDDERVGMDWVPESSRRARVLPLYALIRTLGRSGIQQMIASTCRHAQRMAMRLQREPGIEVLNEVVLNQVLVRFDPAAVGGGTIDDAHAARAHTRAPSADEATRDVIARVQADGTCWVGGAIWQGQQVMRISVSNWATSEEDIDRSADAIVRCWHQRAAP